MFFFCYLNKYEDDCDHENRMVTNKYNCHVATIAPIINEPLLFSTPT